MVGLKIIKLFNGVNINIQISTIIMKRFKTKQELKRDGQLEHFYDIFRGMGITRRFGIPANERYSDLITTHNPHPFDSINIKVQVTPEQSKKLVKKAKRMGYSLLANINDLNINDNHGLQIHNGTVGVLCRLPSHYEYFAEQESIELTYKQFMNGTVPKKDKLSGTTSHTQTEEKEFKVGDFVEVIDNPGYVGVHNGSIGEIYLIDPDHYIRVHIETCPNDIIGFKQKQIQHTSKQPEKNVKFVIGDYVQITDLSGPSDAKTSGVKEGDIYKVEETTLNVTAIKVNGQLCYLTNKRLKHTTKRPESKLMFKGYEVIIKQTSSPVGDKMYSCGCFKPMHRRAINTFLAVCDKLKESDVELDETYDFIQANKDRLGL